MSTTFRTESRQANVTIRNDTGETVLSVRVYHKYSDTNLKDNLEWTATTSAGITSFPAQIVRYHIGAFTTGRDWWIVTWANAGGDYYITAPKNLRGLVDVLEKAGKGVAGALLGAGAGVLVAGPEAVSKIIGAAAAGTGALLAGFTNSESTAGFKQHILRKEDAGRDTTIVLKTSGVEFKSHSGASKTGVEKITKEAVADLLK